MNRPGKPASQLCSSFTVQQTAQGELKRILPLIIRPESAAGHFHRLWIHTLWTDAHLPGQQKPLWFLPAGRKSPWQERRRRKVQALLFWIKSNNHWWCNYSWQRTRDSSVKAASIGCRKAGRKQTSLMDGTSWKESSGEFILTKKDLQASVACWACSGQRKVPTDTWPKSKTSVRHDCLDLEHNTKAEQAPGCLPVY